MNASGQNAKDIFAEALALKSSSMRRDYLELVCAGNVALREEVESLLAAHEQAGDFLGKTVVQDQNRSSIGGLLTVGKGRIAVYGHDSLLKDNPKVLVSTMSYLKPRP